MTTPVLIPARNEAEHIGRTLETMPRGVEPIVIINGCTDNTKSVVEEYEQYGVQLVESSTEGKLPALKEGIRYLGTRAKEPFITLDAETRPVAPGFWINVMKRSRTHVEPKRPVLITGPFFYEGLNPLEAIVRNGKRVVHMVRAQNSQRSISGANMLLDLNDDATIEEILELPHIWPGEDRAIGDVILDHGGVVSSTLNPLAMTITHSRRLICLAERMRLGRDGTEDWLKSSYLSDAAPGSVPYWDYASVSS